MRIHLKIVVMACAVVGTGILCAACSKPGQPQSTQEAGATPLSSTRAAAGDAMKTEPPPQPAFAEIAVPAAGSSAGTATGQVIEFALPSPTAAPSGIAAGADGNLWIAETGANKIARVTPAGEVTEFPLAAGSLPSSLAAGPDGNVWFTQRNGVGRITPDGTVTIVAVNGIPTGIAPGPDGNLWFTENFRGAIGRVTPSGEVTLFPIPKSAGQGSSNPLSVAAGPDGNMWFTESNPRSRKVGRITPTGVITEFSVPGEGSLYAIAAGPDGNMWFTAEHGAQQAKVAKITPNGAISEYALPSPRPQPSTIASGPDGNLWVTESNNTATKVARITPAGSVTEFPVLTKFSGPYGLTVGPDGNLWFTEKGKGRFGRLNTAVANTRYVLHLASGFVPNAIAVTQGHAVEWINQVPALSSVRQASAAPIFDSSAKDTGTMSVIRFPVAGTYAYGDHLHPSHTGTVTVPMQVAPESGTETSSFVVTWATGAEPVVSGGWVIDVQVATPNGSDFEVWQDGVTTTAASYGPTAGKGLYRFRTRLRHQTATGGSDWSPVASITVR